MSQVRISKKVSSLQKAKNSIAAIKVAAKAKKESSKKKTVIERHAQPLSSNALLIKEVVKKDLKVKTPMLNSAHQTLIQVDQISQKAKQILTQYPEVSQKEIEQVTEQLVLETLPSASFQDIHWRTRILHQWLIKSHLPQIQLY